jgi:hypothetical protein
MSESIIEFRIKGYSIKVDKESMSIFDKNDLLFKANFQQVKAISQWLITKANELKNASEIKKIETKE